MIINLCLDSMVARCADLSIVPWLEIKAKTTSQIRASYLRSKSSRNFFFLGKESEDEF